MAAHLRLKGVDLWGNVNSADLQIGVNQGVDGQQIGVFELKGDNGGSDGGTWEWERNPDGFVIMKMKSNLFGEYVAELHAREWILGIIPPPKPSIKLVSRGWFVYTFPGLGAKVHCDWHVVKVVGAEF